MDYCANYCLPGDHHPACERVPTLTVLGGKADSILQHQTVAAEPEVRA